MLCRRRKGFRGPPVYRSRQPDKTTRSTKGSSARIVPPFRLVRAQRFGEAQEVLRMHANDAAAWTVDVRDEEERNGHDQRQNQEEGSFRPGISHPIADQ